MEIALINNNSLILGPMGLNVRFINSELEDLEVEDRITRQSFAQLPIHFSDNQTHLVPIEKVIPPFNVQYHNIGNFEWEIIEENNVPIKVRLTYQVGDKTLSEVKLIKKQEVSSTRKVKENAIISININGVVVQVSTSREERVLLASKLSSLPGPHNFKFKNTWLEITTQELQTILSEIDKFVQEAFDWELTKLQEIDACESIDDVYAVVIQEEQQLEVME